MNIYANSGHKVVAKHLDWGYEPDKEQAHKYLEQDAIYTVSYTEVSSWHTDVYLEEIPGVKFNSVHFEDAQ